MLWAARLNAVGEGWHLAARAVPSLKPLAENTDEPRLHQAATIAANAADHFLAARDALREVLDLIKND